MKEIKFRAWDKEEKEMLELVTVGCTRKDSWGPLYIKDNIINGFDHRNYDVMQYTGLKDKNGVEIYEGDIVKITQQGPIDKCIPNNSNNEIVYKDSAFCVKETREISDIEWPIVAGLYYKLSEEFEVIGNVYENPELLEVAGK